VNEGRDIEIRNSRYGGLGKSSSEIEFKKNKIFFYRNKYFFLFKKFKFLDYGLMGGFTLQNR